MNAVLRRDKLADSYFIIATINCPIRIQCRYIYRTIYHSFIYIQLREFYTSISLYFFLIFFFEWKLFIFRNWFERMSVMQVFCFTINNFFLLKHLILNTCELNSEQPCVDRKSKNETRRSVFVDCTASNCTYCIRRRGRRRCVNK